MSDLAHSLKTPLAVLRTRLDNDASEAELRAEVDIQLRRMNDLVGYQLGRAASAGRNLFAAPIAIEPPAEQMVRGLQRIYAEPGVVCEVEIEPDAQVDSSAGHTEVMHANTPEEGITGGK